MTLAGWGWLALAAVAVAVVLTFNWMIRLRNGVEFAFASIDAMLKQRYDLVPSLVEACRGYAAHERAVLAEVAELRAKAMRLAREEAFELNGRLSGRLADVLAIAEGYPQLKASESFDFLSRSLNEVEAQIAASRRAYNAAVLAYNNACQTIPTCLVAAAMGYGPKKMLEIADERRSPAGSAGA